MLPEVFRRFPHAKHFATRCQLTAAKLANAFSFGSWRGSGGSIGIEGISRRIGTVLLGARISPKAIHELAHLSRAALKAFAESSTSGGAEEKASTSISSWLIAIRSAGFCAGSTVCGFDCGAVLTAIYPYIPARRIGYFPPLLARIVPC